MSDEDWSEVKAPKKKKMKPMVMGSGPTQYGGMTAKGTLIAGPV